MVEGTVHSPNPENYQVPAGIVTVGSSHTKETRPRAPSAGSYARSPGEDTRSPGVASRSPGEDACTFDGPGTVTHFTRNLTPLPALTSNHVGRPITSHQTSLTKHIGHLVNHLTDHLTSHLTTSHPTLPPNLPSLPDNKGTSPHISPEISPHISPLTPLDAHKHDY